MIVKEHPINFKTEYIPSENNLIMEYIKGKPFTNIYHDIVYFGHISDPKIYGVEEEFIFGAYDQKLNCFVDPEGLSVAMSKRTFPIITRNFNDDVNILISGPSMVNENIKKIGILIFVNSKQEFTILT